MSFPFKVRFNDPELEKLIKGLQKDRCVIIKNKNLAKRMGWKIRPIRQDIYLGHDRKYRDKTFMALPPGVKIEKGKHNNYIFKMF